MKYILTINDHYPEIARVYEFVSKHIDGGYNLKALNDFTYTNNIGTTHFKKGDAVYWNDSVKFIDATDTYNKIDALCVLHIAGKYKVQYKQLCIIRSNFINGQYPTKDNFKFMNSLSFSKEKVQKAVAEHCEQWI